MNAIFAWLATYAAHSTLLLGGVALLTTFVVRRDAWRETLWKVALLGGLVTASLQLAFGVRPLVGRIELPQSEALAPAPRATAAPAADAGGHATPVPGHAAAPAPAHVTAPAPEHVTPPSAAPGPSHAGLKAETAAPEPEPPRPGSLPARFPPWPGLVIAAWGGMAAFGVSRLIQRQLLLRRLLNGRREVTDPTPLAMLAQLRRHAGVWRMVRLCTTPRASTPFAVGASEICVPERLFDALTIEERRCAIAHELAHLARRDPLWQLVGGVMEAAFFFQPLNRLATRRLREAAEYLSDEWAVRQTGSAMGLARCLAAVASWVTPEDVSAPHVTMAMAEGGSPLLKRVERLLGQRTPARAPRRAVRAAAAVTILAATVGAAPGITTRDTMRLLEPADVTTTGGSARILYPADPKEPLALRFAGSVTEAAQRGERDTWIGYECRSVVPMGRDFTADSRIAPEDRPRREPSSVVFHSSRDRSRNPGAPDAVILIHVRAEPGGGFTVLRAAGGSPTLELDPDGLPVYWLSSAGEGESVSLLAALGPHASEVHVRSKLLDIIAIHRDSAAVVSYLSDVLDGDYVMNVRAAAVEGLAWHPSPAVVERLLNTALGDRSKLVRKEAAEALGETGANEAAAALDEIIRSQNVPVDTRVEAVEALGSIHRPDILRRLTGLAFGPYDRKIQDEAVETVADLGMPEAFPVLKVVALKHPDPSVRAEAISALAKSGRSASLEVLFRIAMSDPEPHIQHQATERIADFQFADAAPYLRRVAWENETGMIRREAVRLIGSLPEAVGMPLLNEIIAGHPDDEVRERAVSEIGAYHSEESTRRLGEIVTAEPTTACGHLAQELLTGAPTRSTNEGDR
jgi:HEAT repeat protein